MIQKSFAQSPASAPRGRSGASGYTRAGCPRYRRLLSVLAMCGLAPVTALAQHVHGVIELGVVVEGEMVAVSMNAPLSDVVGFEYAPQSDEEVARVRRAAAMLSDSDAMFGLPDAANCSSSGISVDGPAYLDEEAGTGDNESADHDHHSHDDDSDHHDHDEAAGDDHDHGEEHGDDHHDHSDDHDHDHGDEHAELTANYEWTCNAPSNLDALELRFVDGFADVAKIEVQILTLGGVRVITAGRDTGSVSLATE